MHLSWQGTGRAVAATLIACVAAITLSSCAINSTNAELEARGFTDIQTMYSTFDTAFSANAGDCRGILVWNGRDNTLTGTFSDSSGNAHTFDNPTAEMIGNQEGFDCNLPSEPR